MERSYSGGQKSRFNNGLKNLFAIMLATLFLVGCTTPRLETENYVDAYQNFNTVVDVLLTDYQVVLSKAKGISQNNDQSSWPPTSFKPVAVVGQNADSLATVRAAAASVLNYNELLLKLARGEDVTKLDKLTSKIEEFATPVISGVTGGPLISAVFDQLRAAKSYGDFVHALRYATEQTRLSIADQPASGLVLCADGATGCHALVPEIVRVLASLAEDFDHVQQVVISKTIDDALISKDAQLREARLILTTMRRPVNANGGEMWDQLREQSTKFFAIALDEQNFKSAIKDFGSGDSNDFDHGRATELTALITPINANIDAEVHRFYEYRAGLKRYQILAGTTLQHLQAIRVALDQPPDFLGNIRGVLPDGLHISEEANAVLDILISSRR